MTIEIQGLTETERNNWIRNLLRQGVYNVTFTKVNGEVRTMPCTLDPKSVPPMPVKETASRPRKDDVLSVWCVDKQEWRSFRVMNITEVNEYN